MGSDTRSTQGLEIPSILNEGGARTQDVHLLRGSEAWQQGEGEKAEGK
jgi:hypothetical protein